VHFVDNTVFLCPSFPILTNKYMLTTTYARTDMGGWRASLAPRAPRAPRAPPLPPPARRRTAPAADAPLCAPPPNGPRRRRSRLISPSPQAQILPPRPRDVVLLHPTKRNTTSCRGPSRRCSSPFPRVTPARLEMAAARYLDRSSTMATTPGRRPPPPLSLYGRAERGRHHGRRLGCGSSPSSSSPKKVTTRPPFRPYPEAPWPRASPSRQPRPCRRLPGGAGAWTLRDGRRTGPSAKGRRRPDNAPPLDGCRCSGASATPRRLQNLSTPSSLSAPPAVVSSASPPTTRCTSVVIPHAASPAFAPATALATAKLHLLHRRHHHPRPHNPNYGRSRRPTSHHLFLLPRCPQL
jgi:hypothetical protein